MTRAFGTFTSPDSAAPVLPSPDGTAPAVRSANALVVRIGMVGLVAYILLSPYYYFRSGLPQAADAVIVLFLFVIILAWSLSGGALRLHGSFARVTSALAWFIAWAAFVSVVNALVFSNPDLLRPAFYYAYNGLVFALIGVVITYNRQRGLTVLSGSLALALWLSPIFGPPFPNAKDEGYARLILGFNNPNQLALFCLCVAVGTTGAYFVTHRKTYPYLFTVTLSGVLIGLTASRGAILGFFTLLLTLALVKGRGMLLMLFLVCAALVAVVEFDEYFALSAARFGRISESAGEELERRGYDRLIRFPGQLLFGAGEGYRERFARPGYGAPNEIHSTYSTIAFSYGVVGILLMGWAALQFVRATGVRMTLLLLPLLLYATTHNTLRFTTVWITGAMVLWSGILLREARSLSSPRTA